MKKKLQRGQSLLAIDDCAFLHLTSLLLDLLKYDSA